MSSSGGELLVLGERNLSLSVSQKENGDAVPPQLKEVIELVGSLNRRIEDCAVEWQARISQAQWRILDSKQDNESWEQSVLARTYFTDKVLDDAFQGLLEFNKNFVDHLQNFVALLRGEKPTIVMKQTCNAENQCSDLPLQEEKGISALSPVPPPLDLSALHDESIASRKNKVPDKTQQSFTDLVKAKIHFDTKFLGFEATLNGAARTSSDPSVCLCRLCSNVLQEAVGNKTKIVRSFGAGRRKTRRRNKVKYKRLTRAKGRGGKRSLSLARFCDQSPLTSDRSFKSPLLH